MREDIPLSFMCPVCGFPDMEEPPDRFAICPSCGTEFGNHDFVFDTRDYPAKLAELRAAWLAAGAPWFDDGMDPPATWNPWTQAIREGLGFSISTSPSMTSSDEAESDSSFCYPRFMFSAARA